MKRSFNVALGEVYGKPSPAAAEASDMESQIAPATTAVAEPEGFKVTLDSGEDVMLDHGAVVISAITSCTNTSNPSVMVGAGLLAKRASEHGLTAKPWVKTSMAPGSKVVTDYLDTAGLSSYLENLGFYYRRLRLHYLYREQRAAAGACRTSGI